MQLYRKMPLFCAILTRVNQYMVLHNSWGQCKMMVCSAVTVWGDVNKTCWESAAS